MIDEDDASRSRLERCLRLWYEKNETIILVALVVVSTAMSSVAVTKVDSLLQKVETGT